MCAVKREKDWRGAGASREGKSERGRKRGAGVASNSESCWPACCSAVALWSVGLQATCPQQHGLLLFCCLAEQLKCGLGAGLHFLFIYL
jgi:hypothetical protein